MIGLNLGRSIHNVGLFSTALYESYDPFAGAKLPWTSFNEENKDYFRKSARVLALNLLGKMKEPNEEILDNCADSYHVAREKTVAHRKESPHNTDDSYINANFPIDWLQSVLNTYVESYELMLIEKDESCCEGQE